MTLFLNEYTITQLCEAVDQCKHTINDVRIVSDYITDTPVSDYDGDRAANLLIGVELLLELRIERVEQVMKILVTNGILTDIE